MLFRSKNAEEERKLIDNATPKYARAVTKWSLKHFLELQNGMRNKNPAIDAVRIMDKNEYRW